MTIISFGSGSESHFGKNEGANCAGHDAVRLAGTAARPPWRPTVVPATTSTAAAGDPVARAFGGHAAAVVAAAGGGIGHCAQYRHAGVRAACAGGVRSVDDGARHVCRRYVAG